MFRLTDYKYEVGGAKNGFFTRNKYFDLKNPMTKHLFSKFIKDYDNTDVYTSIYMYDRDNIDEAKLYGPLYMDLDGDINSKKGFESLKRDILGLIQYFRSIGLKDNEIKIYFSGSKGFHMLINAQTLGIVPESNLNAMYKAWILYFTHTLGIKSLDLQIYDKRRLFRIPNSINSKTGLYKIELTPDEIYSLTAEAIKERAKKKPRVNNNADKKIEINKQAAIFFYKKSQNFYRKKDPNSNEKRKPIELPEKKTELLPCVKTLLESSIGKGNRNNTAVALASALIQSGYHREEVIVSLMKWNENNNPPLPEREIETTVNSAYGMVLSGKRYGCSAFREMGCCVDNNCKIPTRQGD